MRWRAFSYNKRQLFTAQYLSQMPCTKCWKMLRLNDGIICFARCVPLGFPHSLLKKTWIKSSSIFRVISSEPPKIFPLSKRFGKLKECNQSFNQTVEIRKTCKHIKKLGAQVLPIKIDFCTVDTNILCPENAMKFLQQVTERIYFQYENLKLYWINKKTSWMIGSSGWFLEKKL